MARRQVVIAAGEVLLHADVVGAAERGAMHESFLIQA